jgi:hypothetical protein
VEAGPAQVPWSAADCVPLAWGAFAAVHGRLGNRPVDDGALTGALSALAEALGADWRRVGDVNQLVRAVLAAPGSMVLVWVRPPGEPAHVFWLVADDRSDTVSPRWVDPQAAGQFDRPVLLDKTPDWWAVRMLLRDTRVAGFDPAGQPAELPGTVDWADGTATDRDRPDAGLHPAITSRPGMRGAGNQPDRPTTDTTGDTTDPTQRAPSPNPQAPPLPRVVDRDEAVALFYRHAHRFVDRYPRMTDLWTALVNHMDDNGYIEVSQERLADDLTADKKISKFTVRKYTKMLLDGQGRLLEVVQEGAQGGGISAIYQVVDPGWISELRPGRPWVRDQDRARRLFDQYVESRDPRLRGLWNALVDAMKGDGSIEPVLTTIGTPFGWKATMVSTKIKLLGEKGLLEQVKKGSGARPAVYGVLDPDLVQEAPLAQASAGGEVGVGWVGGVWGCGGWGLFVQCGSGECSASGCAVGGWCGSGCGYGGGVAWGGCGCVDSGTERRCRGVGA